MLIKYENYFIATDANHVTQHRRVVTPWFYVKLKSINYEKFHHAADMVFGLWPAYSIWFTDKSLLVEPSIIRKLETVTLPFSFDERMAK